MDWVEKFFDEIYPDDLAALSPGDERTERETDFIIAELKLDPGARVLDLACGRGRHALGIAPRVGSVLGVDRTESYIQAAKAAAAERGLDNVEFIIQDMRELDFDGEFDAAFNYFTAWGYYDDATNLDILRRARECLKPGGRFLLEFIGRDALMRAFRPQGFSMREDGSVVLQERSFDFETGRMHVTYTLVTPERRNSVIIDLCVPPPDGLIRLLCEAGFQDCRAVSAPDGGRVTMDSWRVAVIGARP